MKAVIITTKLSILLCIYFLTSSTSLAQFTAVPGLTNNPCVDVDILSTSQVWIAGYYGAYKSTNGGVSVSNVNYIDTTNTPSNTSFDLNYARIHPISMSKVLLFGDMYDTSDGILKTNLGNGYWGQVYLESENPEYDGIVSDVDIADDGIGVACGGNGLILRSTDFGNSWQLISPGPVSTDYEFVHFFGNNVWTIISKTAVLRSTDHGLTWNTTEITELTTINAEIRDFSVKGDVCFISTERNYIGKSTDQGITWEFISIPFMSGLIEAGSASVLYCVDTPWNKLYKSIDSGATWENIPIQNMSGINDIEFFNANFGGIAGTGNGAQFTSNGGGPTLPYCYFTVPQNSCSDEILPVINQGYDLPGYTYEWFVDGNLVSTDFNLVYQVPSPGYYEIELITTNENGSSSYYKETNVVAPPTTPILNVTFSQDTICSGSSVSFTVQSSQGGTNYKYYKNGVLQNSQTGNGSNIIFSTGNISDDTFVEIHATRSTLCRTDTTTFSQMITVVSVNPEITVFLPADTVCTTVSTYMIGVSNSDPLWSYRYNSGNPPYYPGNNDTLLIPFSTSNTTPFTPSVQAKFNQTGCTQTITANSQLFRLSPSSVLTINPLIVSPNEPLSINLVSNYLEHNWQFGENAVVQENNGLSPIVSYTTTGIDTIYVNEVFADSACFRTHERTIHIVEDLTAIEPNLCQTESIQETRQTIRSIIDASGNHILCGYYLSSGNSASLFIRKESQTGELIYEKTSPSAYGISVATDASQNIYLIGQAGSGIIVWGQYLSNSTFFAKLNPQGELVWLHSSPEVVYQDLVIQENTLHLLCRSVSPTGTVSIDQGNGSNYEIDLPYSISNFSFFVEMDVSGMISSIMPIGIGTNKTNPSYHSSITFLNSAPMSYPKMKISGDDIFVLGNMGTYYDNTDYIFGSDTLENTITDFGLQNSNPNLGFLRRNISTNEAKCKLLLNSSTIIPHDFVVLENSILASCDIHYSNYFDHEGIHDYNSSLTTTNRSCLYSLDYDGHMNWQRVEYYCNYLQLEKASATTAYAAIAVNNQSTILSTETNWGYSTEGVNGSLIVTIDEQGSVSNILDFDDASKDVIQSMQIDACGNLQISQGSGIVNTLYPLGTYNSATTWSIKKVGTSICDDGCSSNILNNVFDLAMDDMELIPLVDNSSLADVQLTIQNLGATSITDVSISYNVNGIDFTYTTDLSLLPSESATLILGTVDISNLPYHHCAAEFTLINSLSSDDVAINNEILRTQWICPGPLSGTYTVGFENNEFNTFQQTATALATCGVDGPVEFVIDDGDYFGQLVVPVFVGNTSNNSITWRSSLNSSENVHFHYSNDNQSLTSHISISSGVSYLTFEALSIVDSLSYGQTVAILLNTLCNNINFQQCSFYGLSSQSHKLISSSSISTNKNILISENLFYKSGNAITFDGSSNNKDENLSVIGNTFIDQFDYSVYCRYALNTRLESNSILDSTSVSINCVLISNTTGNLIIKGNEFVFRGSTIIQVLSYTGNASNPGLSLIANNMVTNVYNFGSVALYLSNVSNISVWHNTFQGAVELSNCSNLDIENNIIGNALYLLEISGTAVNFTIDHNQYYPYISGSIQFSAPFGISSSLSAWQTNSGYDGNSIVLQPTFTNQYDSHILLNYSTGIPIPLVTNDIDGEPRSLISPVIGADEPVDIPFQIYPIEVVQPSCYGYSNGSINVMSIMSEGEVVFTWEDGFIGSFRENLSAGQYTCTAVDESENIATMTFTLIQPAYFDFEIEVDDDCFNGYNASAIPTGYQSIPPMTYAWSNGEDTFGVASLTNGTYWAQITNANGCTAQDTVTISATPYLVTLNQIIQTSCPTEDGGLIDINVQGGDGNYTYQWSNGQTSQDISGLLPDTYSVLVTDGDGCELNYSRTLYETLTIDALTSSSCISDNSGSASLVRTGGGLGFDYLWSTGETSQQITNLSGGWYSVEVTDGTGCTAEDSVYISQVDWTLSLDQIQQPCLPSDISAIWTSIDNLTPIETIQWSNGATELSIEGIAPGDYQLMVSDTSGCMQQVNASISLTPVAEIISDVDCFDGSNATLQVLPQVSIPSSILWNTGQTSTTINGVGNGDYWVQLTYPNGCQNTLEISVEETVFNVIVDTILAPNCWYDLGEIQLIIEGGTSPYDYEWSNGAQTINLTNAPIGNYSFNISDSQGCALEIDTQLTSLHEPFSFDLIGPAQAYLDSTDIFTLILPDGFTTIWNINDALLLDSTIDSVWVEFNEIGFAEIQCTLVDDLGCVASDQINVDVEEYISVEESKPIQINAYPNPVIDQLTIQSGYSTPLHLDVIDALGNVIWTGTLYQTLEIETSNWAAGSYTLRCSDLNTTISQYFIIKF